MWPSHCVRLVPRPKNRWAGRHFGPSRGPAWAKFGLLVASRSQPSSAADLDPTAVHGFRRNKSRPVADALNPSPFFSPPPLFSQRTSGGGVAQSAAGSSLATARSAARHTAATVSPLLFSILSFPLLLYSRTREIQRVCHDDQKRKVVVAPPRVLSPASAFPTRESALSSSGCATVPFWPKPHGGRGPMST
jgi:hypothetical protein